jgi:hypothetical protein
MPSRRVAGSTSLSILSITHSSLAAITLILLLIAASRILHLTDLEMAWDEVWSIWQTFGSPVDIVRWTPNDWPPLFFLTLGAWKEFVGFQPEPLRYLSVLSFLIGSAFTYRATRRINLTPHSSSPRPEGLGVVGAGYIRPFSERAALLVTLAYAAMGLSVFLSLVVRGYSFLLALTPLALWLTVRYFEAPTSRSMASEAIVTPSVRRAIYLALCMAAMFYIHLISVFIFALLGIYTLLVYRRAVWHWWLPGIMVGGLSWFMIIPRLSTLSTRGGYNALLPLPPLPEALIQKFVTFTGSLAIAWGALFLISAVVFALQLLRRQFRPQIFALLIWLLSPIPIYLFHSRLGLFQDVRYLWWVMPGLALWLGIGLSYLPRLGFNIALVAFAALLFLPSGLEHYEATVFVPANVPMETNFKLLREEMQPGDVLLIDPNCQKCAPLEAWDYFMRAYFPNGLRFVDNPDGYRRVWYVSRGWLQDPATKEAVLKNRVEGKFFGPPTFLFRLYEGPPDQAGVLFENGLRFHGVDIQGLPTPRGVVLHEGEKFKVRLWWSVDRPLDRDYSTSLQIPIPASLIQLDGPPKVIDAPTQTSRWQTGRFYVDDREIQLPYPLKPGTFTLYLTVYQWWDNVRILAPGVNQDRLLPIGQITVQSWSQGW